MRAPLSPTPCLLLLGLGACLLLGCPVGTDVLPAPGPPEPPGPTLPEVVVPPEADLSGTRGVVLEVSAQSSALPGFTEVVSGGTTEDGAGAFEVRSPDGLVLHEGRVAVGLPRTVGLQLPSRHARLQVVLHVPGGAPRTLEAPVQDGRAVARFE